MMVEPLTAAVIVSLFFSEVIKEGGKALGKSAAEKITLLTNAIRRKFKAEGTEGLLNRVENQPTEANKAKFQDELQTQMDADKDFTNQLKQLIEQLKNENEQVCQVILKGIEAETLKTRDISQKADRGGSVEQEILTDVKAKNIAVDNISQGA